MDFSHQAIIYMMLIIPTLFALVVIGQGISKINREEAGGKMIVGFGVAFLALIAATYFFFIR